MLRKNFMRVKYGVKSEGANHRVDGSGESGLGKDASRQLDPIQLHELFQYVRRGMLDRTKVPIGRCRIPSFGHSIYDR